MFITNRHKQKISVIVERPERQSGLVFVMNGLGGWKDQPHIVAIAEAFRENDYTTVRFDTTNTFGESDGRYEDATTTNYYEDLEDVIDWAQTQDWFVDPFAVAGHSLGGICTALYAERHPEQVQTVLPISTVVSGQLSGEAHGTKMLEQWQRDGWHERESETIKGRIKRLPWSHMVDRLQYDLMPGVGKLTMPVLLVVGSKDETTPLKHQQILFDALPDKKALHVIAGGPHTFRSAEHITELKTVISDWLKDL